MRGTCPPRKPPRVAHPARVTTIREGLTGGVSSSASVTRTTPWGGFYKRGCQEKTLFPLLENRWFFGIQPFSSCWVAEIRSSLMVFTSTLQCRSRLKLHKPNGDRKSVV